MTIDAIQVSLLGKEIGTANGWDEVDENTYLFYNFMPNEFFRSCFLAKFDAKFDLTIAYSDAIQIRDTETGELVHEWKLKSIEFEQVK